MATVTRPPFYVPRPADETYWSGTPLDSPVIPFLTKQKFFGAGGQVPTKLWAPLYTFDDPSVWYAAPVPSTILEFLTKQTMFGKGGQVPMKQWRYDYDVGESFWYATPIDSAVLHPLLTAAGQVRSRQWLFSYDDSSVWQGAPIASDLLVPILSRKPFTRLRSFDNDDFSAWFPWINRNLAALSPSVSPLVNYTWRFHNDDSAVWSGSPLGSETIPFFTVGGKPPTKHWNYDLDDPPAWQLTYQRNLIPAAGAPTIAQRWNYNLDDPGGWQWQAPSLIALQLIPYTVGPTFADNYDDPSVWSWKPLRDQPLLTIQANPFTSLTWRFNLDDPSVWNGQPLPVPSLNIPHQNPFFNLRLIGSPDDSSIWSGQPIRSNTGLLSTTPLPFLTKQWNGFSIPEDQPWTVSSSTVDLLYIPIVISFANIQRTLTGVGL